MTPRHFGHAFGFERPRAEHVIVEDRIVEDRAATRWTAVAIVAVVLLLGGGLYLLNSGVQTMIALAPIDETSGQGTRPTLPTLPQ